MSEYRDSLFWAKVDKSDSHGGCWVWTAAVFNTGYGAFGVDGGKTVSAHRYAYEYANGPIPEGMVLDHICHNRACVNPEHLRLCTFHENMLNRKMKSSNTSGLKGVSWHSGARKWRATIVYGGKQVHLGFFVDKAEAHRAYCEAARSLHREFANFGDVA